VYYKSEFSEKPTLSQKLERVQTEIDDLVLLAFTILGATERRDLDRSG
jgi:hypothetical protein